MPEPQVVGIVAGLLVAVLIPLIRFFHRREAKLKKYYEVRWKKSSALRPMDLLSFRGEPRHGFDQHYHPRQQDRLIKQMLERGESVLVLGWPLAGKSRAVYQALVEAPDPYDVIVPSVEDVDRGDFLIPRRLSFWRKPVLVLDDLDKYVERQDFSYLFHRFVARDVVLVATCRKGEEYDSVCGQMHRELSAVFGAPVEIGRISTAEARDVGRRTNRVVPRRFDGNIGSIFLELGTMRERFHRCTTAQRMVLRSVARLYFAGAYEGREIFSLERVQRVCSEIEGLLREPDEWAELLERLQQKGFMERQAHGFWAEEAYLDSVVELQVSALDNLQQMVRVFDGDPEALLRIANRASSIALWSVEKAACAALAIDTYGAVLLSWTMQDSPERRAMTQNNLGNAYGTLAEVEEKGENCRRAIGAYEEALRVRTLLRTSRWTTG